MNIELHPSSERGAVELGWLHTRHSFSFADYYNPQRMGFGALRVLNEDIIAPAQGFGMHPHDNMEIVTIVLEGALEHKDSMGNHGVIKAGDIQRMSAGTGIVHSEYNHSQTERVHLLQIWVRTKVKNIPPSYEQKSFPIESLQNKLVPIVSGEKNSGAVYIHQDAIFSLARLAEGKSVSPKITDQKHGLYGFVIEGDANFAGNSIKSGDAVAIRDAGAIEVTANKQTHILLIEVPLY